MTVWDVVWAGWILAFLALEIAALCGAPWQTLSSTAWSIETLTTWAKVLALVGLTVLTTHICFRFPA